MQYKLDLSLIHKADHNESDFPAKSLRFSQLVLPTPGQ